MSETANPGAADESVPKGFTAEDLRLGKRAVGHVRIVSAVAFLACVAITVFVFLNVPWDTRMPYDGKYSSNGIPMQVALLVILVLLGEIWRSGKKPAAHHLGKAGRVGVYLFIAPVVLGFVYFHWVMAKSILEAGGYLAG